MKMIKEAKVIEVKKSEVRKGTYYITVNDGYGDIKVVGTRNYEVGETVKIKRRNALDWVWDIVKEKK